MTLKIRIILFAVTAMTCLSACTKNNIVDKKQLENILFEMHLADGIFHTMAANHREQNLDSVFRYEHILKKYKCSRNKFEQSMRAYSKNKDGIDLIYTNVQKRLEVLLSEFDGDKNLYFTEDFKNKLTAPIRDFLLSIENYFKDIENFDDFRNKILNSEENATEGEEISEFAISEESAIELISEVELEQESVD